MPKTTTRTSTKTAKTEKAPILYKKIGLTQAKKLGQELANFAEQNNLLVEIAGKKYMMVEGWQFIGTQIGLTDIVKYCDRVEPSEFELNRLKEDSLTYNEIKYKAVVEVINQNGTVISKGFAFASNKEKKKTSFEEYAIASMAQTRAIGKAYRNFLAWIVKMAGYEATPFEEVDKDKMENDLSKARRDVLAALNEAGITDSSDMIKIIQTATGKSVLETVDDANKVFGFLREMEDNNADA